MPDQIHDDLLAVLAGLTPAQGASAAALESARRAVAIARLTGQQTGHAIRPIAGSSPPVDVETTQAVDELTQQLGSTKPAALRVVRRDNPMPISADPRIGPAPGAGQVANSTIGPFQDSLGRLVSINVFDVPTRIGIARGSGA